jgi:hypothetical protein
MIIAIVIGIGIAIWIVYELYEAPTLDEKGNVVDIKSSTHASSKNLDIMESDFNNEDEL